MKLNCASMADPAFQLALKLHAPQNANEVFLLSLRDCLGALPTAHPMRRWYERKAPFARTLQMAPVRQALQGELREVWGSGKRPSKGERAALARILDVLEKSPPYLDLTVLQAASYQRLGNTARAQQLLLAWLEVPLLERIARTPVRRDVLGAHVREHWDTFIDVLAEEPDNRLVMELLHQGILEFMTDPKVREKSEKARDLDDAELLLKLRLRYHQARSPAFTDWVINKQSGGTARQRFLKRFFESPDARARAWVFLGRMPEDAARHATLAQWLGESNEARDSLFYLLASQPELQGPLTRSRPEVLKNFLKDKRNYFHELLRREPRNPLAMAQLVEMGDMAPVLEAQAAEGP